MIVNLMILAVGIVLGIVAVLLRKKIGMEWMISLLCGAVLVIAVGGMFTWASWKDTQENKRHVYVALQYLERHEIDQASYHLKQVGDDTFASSGAEALLETMRSNTILVQLKLDALESLTRTDEQRGIAARLRSLAPDDFEGQQTLASLLRSQLGLSPKQQKAADRLFVSESGYYLEGLEPEEQELSEAETLRSNINTCLTNGAYSSAVSEAVQLVDLSASSENRLLLAETIAEAVYSGVYLTGYEFATEGEDTPSVVQERESLQKKIDTLTQKADDLQLKIDGAADEEKEKSLSAEQAELMSQIQTLEQDQKYVFARRALSAIADLHSLEAAVVRAKLHYAMLDYEKAVQCLQSAASSPAAWFSTNTNLRNALRLLKKAYNESQTIGTQSVEFKEAMTTLLSSGGNNMISAISSRLTESFSNYIISDQKSYGKDLYVTSVDVSNYPEISVMVSGRDTILEMIKSEKDVIVRDTHNDVSYTVQLPEGDDAHLNICCVVDESGSMGGEPTMNLRNALSGFIAALDDNTSIGIVGFENYYTIHAPMSENHAAAEAAVSQIYASGGTNITAGILGAMEAMRDCQGRKTVLLMTDGQSDIDMNVVQEAAANGYVIHTIGFGGVNDDLLQQIADATGGQYIRAETSTELVRVYLSLVGMLGNGIEIHYTVPEQVEEGIFRYFFIRIPDDNISLWLEYVLPENRNPALHQVYPSLVYESTAADAMAAGRDLTFELFGEDLLDVTQVSVGGQEAEITSEVSDTYLQIQVPASLASGWQTVTLTHSDGTETSFEKMICVAQALDAYVFRFGDLTLYGSQTALTDDGMLVMADNVSVTDESYDGTGDTTLSMTICGVLSVPVDVEALNSQLMDENAGPYIDLSFDGPMEGSGKAYLNSQDSGFAEDAESLVASGSFTIIYEDGQARLVQN